MSPRVIHSRAVTTKMISVVYLAGEGGVRCLSLLVTVVVLDSDSFLILNVSCVRYN